MHLSSLERLEGTRKDGPLRLNSTGGQRAASGDRGGYCETPGKWNRDGKMASTGEEGNIVRMEGLDLAPPIFLRLRFQLRRSNTLELLVSNGVTKSLENPQNLHLQSPI